jgi:hypothetical protein
MVFKPPTVLIATQPCAFNSPLKARIEKNSTKNLALKNLALIDIPTFLKNLIILINRINIEF